jgi:hypothetical protein
MAISHWHAALGHPGPEVLGHLQEATSGASLAGSGPKTFDCQTCALAKAHELVSRQPYKEDQAAEPLARVAYDLIQFQSGYNGDKWASHFHCYKTKMDFVYTHTHKSQAVGVVAEFINMVATRYGKKIVYFRTDGERSLGHKFDDLMADKGITAERSAPATPAQNGAAERSGGVILLKARTMRIGALLPADLWPEIVTTSSTEAELLALSSAAKEAIWWRRFFIAIHFDPQEELTIFCDNRQTIHMLTNDTMKLSTKLKHVDIHQHWLRQEVQAKRIQLKWVSTTEMSADGLTKGLTKQKNDEFVKQLCLVDQPTDQSEAKKTSIYSQKTSEIDVSDLDAQMERKSQTGAAP